MMDAEVFDNVEDWVFLHENRKGELSLRVECSGFLEWALHDSVELTPENIDLFQECVRECIRIDPVMGGKYGIQLFVYKTRKTRLLEKTGNDKIDQLFVMDVEETK